MTHQETEPLKFEDVRVGDTVCLPKFARAVLLCVYKDENARMLRLERVGGRAGSNFIASMFEAAGFVRCK